MKTIKAVMLVLVLACSSVAFSQTRESTWTFVGESQSDNDQYFIEDMIYTNDYGYKAAWFKHIMPVEKVNGRTYYNVIKMELWQAQPRAGRIRVLQSAVYSSTNVLIDSYTFQYPEFFNVIPGTIGEGVYNALTR